MPIPNDPSWDVKDSTKLTTYTMCPRRYFYEYLLGWRLDLPQHDLHFGQAWHEAREHQLLYGYDDINGAYDKFIKHYRKKFPPETDSIYTPKDPVGVLNALVKLNDYYARDLVDNEVVEISGIKMTEISGTVPVDSHRVLHYRMDSIMRNHEGMIFSWDHKSTTERTMNYQYWSDQFSLSLQNGTYTHCLYCLFPIPEVLGIEFYGVGFGFYKRGGSVNPKGYSATIKKVPAFKTPDQMNSWLWQVNMILDEIDRDMDHLSHCKEDDNTLMSFRMNPNSCSSYRGCPYHEFCVNWQNPLRRCSTPPPGFQVDFWDPSKMETRNKLNLERK